MLSLALAALLLAAPAAAAPGRHADVDDVRLYYEVTGSGPPLLVLHGGGGSSRSFTENIASLSKQFTVIAPDSRGHGRSTDSAKPLTYPRMGEDMAELLKQLNLGPVFVLGWSDGGNMGRHLAVHHPELVRKLVVFGANTRVTGLTGPSLAWVKTAGPGSLG
ncbi:MAG: alpha/beta fold hydrolase, partial [Myxococcaceae bacterium]